MWFVHFSSEQNSSSLWTFFPQHAYGVDMYYVGMQLFDAGGSWVYLCFSEDYLRDLNPSSFFLAVTSDPGKASLFRMSSTNRQEFCLMTCTVDYGPLWINHSGPEGTLSCVDADIRAGTDKDGPCATWTHLGQWTGRQSMFKLSAPAPAP